MSTATPAGSGPPQGPPTTPTPLVQASVEVLAVPDMVAVPVQVVPSNATPAKVIWPLNDPPLSVPDT
jgi:hypothetical protein